MLKEPENHPRIPSRWSCIALAAVGWILVGSGIFAMIVAACGNLLPHDVAFLGMTSSQLCALHGCRVVHFMEHDRVSFGGAIAAIGILYHWLAMVPLRRGEGWAWWTLLLSGSVGFASFLTYLGYGYLDSWHAWATIGLLIVYVAGLSASFEGLPREQRSIRVVARPSLAPLIPRNAFAFGRAGLIAVACGLIGAGATIMLIGMTHVFVQTDLAYMGVTPDELRAISPRLIPLIAHDRAGFGGGLCSGGITVLLSAWCGLHRARDRSLWRTLAVALGIGFTAAIAVHPAIGYTSFVHLLPAYLGAAMFVLSIAVIHTAP